MNTMINTCASIMGLQFGSEKCVKIHIGKNHNIDICGKGKVDAWVDEVNISEEGEDTLIYKYIGKVDMKNVEDKKYLGQILSNDLKNDKNINYKVNKSYGNVNKIITTLIERPFGKFTFQAATVMRNGILIGSLLNKSETWIQLTKKNIEEIEKPDKVLKDKLLDSKSSTVFYYLEFGMLPAKYVILKKRLKFLKYILDEDINSMIRRVLKNRKRNVKR